MEFFGATFIVCGILCFIKWLSELETFEDCYLNYHYFFINPLFLAIIFCALGIVFINFYTLFGPDKYIIENNTLYKYNGDSYYSLNKYAITNYKAVEQEVPFEEFKDDIYIPKRYYCKNDLIYDNYLFSNKEHNVNITHILYCTPLTKA